jgi:hypothetical protein
MAVQSPHVRCCTKPKAPTIMASGCMTIVLVEAFFYRVDVIQREVVPWLYLKGHSEHPS